MFTCTQRCPSQGKSRSNTEKNSSLLWLRKKWSRGPGYLTRLALAAGLAPFPEEIVVIVEDATAGCLGSQDDGERERDVAGVGVGVDREKEPDLPLLDVRCERLREGETLAPHLARQLVRLFASWRQVFVEQPGEPFAAVPLVPAVRAGQAESAPGRVEDDVCLVPEVARDAMDRHTGQHPLEAPAVFRDLHRHPVDVVGEGDEGDPAPDAVPEAVCPRLRPVPDQVVEDGADAVPPVDLSLPEILDPHSTPGTTIMSRSTLICHGQHQDCSSMSRIRWRFSGVSPRPSHGATGSQGGDHRDTKGQAPWRRLGWKTESSG